MRIALTLCMAVTTIPPLWAATVLPEDLQRGSDRVDIPAMGKGLCLHNLFQTDMVIQRDKPIRIWGWASPGENVQVLLDGQLGAATAGKDRSWTVTFPALAASSNPCEITVNHSFSTYS